MRRSPPSRQYGLISQSTSEFPLDEKVLDERDTGRKGYWTKGINARREPRKVPHSTVVYPISGFRWSFYEVADVSVSVGVSLAKTAVFLLVCLALVWWIFKTGYRLKS